MNSAYRKQEGTMDIRQVSNKRKYDLAASCYDIIAYVMSLGQAATLYKEVANRLDVPSGGSVVELGCGPASVIPSLLQKLDAATTVVGIDFSSNMISLANRKKEIQQWENVDFQCMDMYEYFPGKKVDSVVFCLALTAMPDYQRAIIKALSLLKPGGQLLILDSLPLRGKWYHPFTNFYVYLKSLIVGARPTKKIVEFIENNAVMTENCEMVSGVYTLIHAKAPAD